MSSSPFAFIPRKVARHVRSQGPSDKEDSKISPPPVKGASEKTSVPESRTKEKGKAKAMVVVEHSKEYNDKKLHCTDEDYAILVSMALSAYALWTDPELHRTSHCGDQATGEEQFIPLSYLLRHSPVLSGLCQSESTDTAIAKALRSCAGDLFETRMIVSETTLSIWKLKKIESLGLFEIRMKDRSSCSQQIPNNGSRNNWEKRTIYVENIPPQYRTIPLIAHFILSLCIQGPTTPHMLKIQNVMLLPSHLDNPGDQPRCKGFALVVLSDLEDINTLLTKWPWNREKTRNKDAWDTDTDREAEKFGFRTLPKRRWQELQEEYLAYRRKLLGDISAPGDLVSNTSPPQAYSQSSHQKRSLSPSRNVSPPPTISYNPNHLPSFPVGCLVFVRNIHPETNKTTLRTLFNAGFDAASSGSQISGDGLDYVDFTKGMDSCHIRLKTPDHSRALVDHFSSCLIKQVRGLDDVGTRPEDVNRAIKMEIVQGKREEVYWEKVPDKVRRQAMQRASDSGDPATAGDAPKPDAEIVKSSRKRRKR